MILKIIKYGVIAGVGVVVVGGLVLGTDLTSYVHSSARSVQDSIKESVPVEFELRRASDMVEQIIPELHANIRLIAQEEVEIAALKADIDRSQEQIAEERTCLTRLREQLAVHTASLATASSSRARLTQELGRRFERFKEADVVLAGKRRLLETREKSLGAAMDMLERTRSQKADLEQQLETLASQHRLVHAASVTANIEVDSSKLAQSQNLIRQIKKRRDVAERVLAHRAHFVEPVFTEALDEQDLLAQVDEYFDDETNEDATTASSAELPSGDHDSVQ